MYIFVKWLNINFWKLYEIDVKLFSFNYEYIIIIIIIIIK